MGEEHTRAHTQWGKNTLVHPHNGGRTHTHMHTHNGKKHTEILTNRVAIHLQNLKIWSNDFCFLWNIKSDNSIQLDVSKCKNGY